MDKNWLLDFSGCDGGTIGSPEKQSTKPTEGTGNSIKEFLRRQWQRNKNG